MVTRSGAGMNLQTHIFEEIIGILRNAREEVPRLAILCMAIFCNSSVCANVASYKPAHRTEALAGRTEDHLQVPTDPLRNTSVGSHHDDGVSGGI